MYLFVYFWLRWVFVGTDFSLAAMSGGRSSLQWRLLLLSTGSRRVGFSRCRSRALELGPSLCGALGLVAPRHVESSRPGVQPVYPALAGGFLTTEPPVSATQSCLTRSNPMDCSPPGSFVHEILQAILLEWVAIPFSGIEPGLLHCRQILYHLSHQGSPPKALMA